MLRIFQASAIFPTLCSASVGFDRRHFTKCINHNPFCASDRDSLSFSSPEAIRTIYGHNTACSKAGTYVTNVGPHPHILDAADKEDHANQPKMLSHAFSTKNLVDWEFKIKDKVVRLVQQIDQICDGNDDTMDWRLWSNLFTIEAIVDITMSQRLGCLDKGSDHFEFLTETGERKTVNFISDLHAGSRATSGLIWSTTWFKAWKSILEIIPGFFRDQWKRRNQYDEMVKALVHERAQKFEAGEEIDDLMSCLFVDKKGSERNLPRGLIESEAHILRMYIPI